MERKEKQEDKTWLVSHLRLSVFVFTQSDRRQRHIRLPLPVCPPVSLSLSLSLRLISVSWSVLHRGGQRGALLGRLAQLYLLLDGTSRVVDERVDQTGHCKYTSNNGTDSC